MLDPSGWPVGAGAMAELVRRKDWSETLLGPKEGWPASLRAIVDLLLASTFPMVALWGPELVQIYNDGYAEIMATKHPLGMGQPTRECWPEVWSFNAPIYEQVRTGKTLTFADQLFRITRHGYLEDAWFTLCYSPLRDERSEVAGVLVTVVEVTERLRAEQKLQLSNRRLYALTTATSDSLYTMNPDWSEMHHLDGAGLLAETRSSNKGWVQEYIDPADQEEVLRAVHESIGSGTTFEMEHRVHRPDGSLRWTLSRAVPVRNDTGEITEWFGAATDVTDRRAAEEQVRDSERLRRVALTGGRMGSWRWDLSRRLVFGDAQFMALWGFPPTDDPRPLADFTSRMSAKGAAQMEEIVTRAIATGEEFDGPLEIVSGPTAGRWIQWRGNAPADDTSTLYGVTFDVTEKQLAEERLRESEANFRMLFEEMSDGYGLGELRRDEAGHAVDFRYILMNPAVERHTGLKVEATTGRWFSELFPGADRSYWLGLFQEVVDTQTIRPFETHWPSVDRWLAGTAAPAKDGRYAIFYQDVTERKRAEEALREVEQRQAFLLRLSDVLRPLQDPIAIQIEAMRLLGEQLQVSRAQYYEAESDGEHVATHGGYAAGLPTFVGRLRVVDFGPHVKKALDEGRTIFVDDVRSDARLTPDEVAAHEALGVRAYLGTSLAKNGHLVALLGLHDAEPRRWTALEISLVDDTAERTWAAVERAKAEKSLRESEELYRTLFNSIDEGVTTLEVLLDEEGKAADWVYLEANPALTRITGLTHDIIGKRATEVYSHLEPYWFEVFGSVARTGQAVRAENFVADLNRWFDFYANRIGGEGSHTVVTVYNDITARKRSEAALREAQERQAFLLKLSDAVRPLADAAAIQSETTRLLGKHLQLDRCYFFEADHQAGEYIIHRDFRREDLRSLAGRHRIEQWPEMTAALSSGEILVVNDYANSPVIPPLERPPTANLNIGAIIIVPLVKQGTLLACISAIQATPRVWREEEVSLVTEIAERTWAAVERARVEAALHASEARLTAAFETVAVGISVLDASGRTVLSNVEFRRFLPDGIIPSRDLKRLRRWRAWDAHGAPLPPESFPGARAMRGERVVPGQEMLYTDDDGREIWTSVATVPIRDDFGNVIGQTCVISDIDREKRLTDRLRSSEEQFRLFVQNVREYALVQTDFEGIITSWNPGAERLFGYSSEETIGQPFSMLLPETERHDGIIAREMAVLSRGEKNVDAHRVQRKGGALFWAEWVTEPVLDDNGKLRGTAKVMRDESERREAQQRLVESEHRLRSVLDGIPQLVWRAAADGQWTWSSTQWQVFTGQSAGESQGEGWLAAIHPDDLPPTQEAWDRARLRRFLDVEHRIRKADGSYVWHHTRSLPYTDPTNGAVEWFGTSTDIATSKKASAENEALLKEVHHRVKNNLQVITSLVNLQSKQIADAAARAQFDETRNRVLSIASIHELLYRSDSFAEIDLTRYARRLGADLLAFYGVQDRVHLEVTGDGIVIELERAVPCGLLLNELLSNALKHAFPGRQPGFVQIKFSMAGERIRVTVKDDGVGMPSSSRSGSSPSLGMTLIEALSTQLGGNITFLSGSGTEAQLDFPVRLEEA